MKNIIIAIMLISSLFAQTKTTDISTKAGAFSRMGFGARGMGMGNALSSVNNGQLNVYYNPALSPFQEKNSFMASYSALSLDRKLNFISFTRKFKFDSPDEFRTAGVSFGLINSGVDDINKYNGQGEVTGNVSTSENMFFFSYANRFSNKLSIGITFKYFQNNLYTDLTAKGLGFDIGALYFINENINLSLGVYDINSKYDWDSSDLFGQNGRRRTEKFPLLKRVGLSYKTTDNVLLVALDYENSDAGTNYIRIGSEYNPYPGLYLRAGLDRLNLSNSEEPVRPTFGFSYFYDVNKMKLGIDYAFVVEPYSNSNQHIIGINFNF